MNRTLRNTWMIGLPLVVVLIGWALFFRYKPICESGRIWAGTACVSVQRVAKRCSQLPEGAEALCRETLRSRAALVRAFSERHRLDRRRQAVLARRVYASYEESVAAFAVKSVAAKYVCYVRKDLAVRCARVSSLLAFYDAEMGSAMLSDIARLYEVHQLSVDEEVLLRCANGKWAGLDIAQEAESAEPSVTAINGRSLLDVFDRGTVDSIVMACADSSDSGGAASPGGFSGITGLDMLGGLGCLGIDLTGPGQEMLDRVNEMMAAARDGCEEAMGQTIMEGNGSANDGKAVVVPQEPPDTPPPVGSSSTTDNGNTTNTNVYVDSEGNTVQVQTTSDQDGNVVSQTTTTWKTNGTKTQNTKTYSSDGSVASTSSSTWHGGGVASHTWTDSEGNTVEAVEYGDGQGGGTGSGGMDVTWPDGEVWIMVPGRNEPVWRSGSGDCVDEACQTCRVFAEESLKLFNDCLGAGASNSLCEDFLGATECCPNGGGQVNVDPRLVIPDPNGDGFICSGGADPDLLGEACEERCKFAESMDCLSTCLSADPSDLRAPQVFLSYCLYSYVEDECVPLLGTGRDGVVPEVGPLPQPYLSLARFSVLPVTSLDMP